MLKYDNYIYLHFFDRELRNSIGEKLVFDDSLACHVLLTALLMSNLPLYVSFSHMYESLEQFPTTIKLAFECEKFGLLKMLTSTRNVDEFLASRRSLYDFDKSRYTNYFNSTCILWPVDTVIVKNDTTTILRNKIFSSIDCDNTFPEKVKISLQQSLVENRKNAITFSFFRNTIQDNYNQLHLANFQYQQSISDIKETISRQYTLRYLEVFDGTIATGIPGFSRYDTLAKNGFLTNYVLFSELFKPLQTAYNHHIQDFLEFRLGNSFQQLCTVLKWVVIALSKTTNDNINIALSVIRQYRLNRSSIKTCNDFIGECIGLYDFISKKADDKEILLNMQTKILLVVATPLELNIMVEKLKSISPVTKSLGSLSYFITTMGDSLVYIVKCQMGQGGVGGSILTLEEAIRVLAPDFVIMGGIAWGANKRKQSIGDLLISTQVWDYDLERVNSDGSTTSRGAVFPSSARLVQMFEVACMSETNYKIDFGLIASGSDLLDNQEYVRELKKKQPELIGGDMESAGMAAVCSRKCIDWILVKGICDWGYNKSSHKDEYQKIAATNSADAISSLLSQLVMS